MKLNILAGQDLSAYACIEIEVPDDATEEMIAEAVQEKIARGNVDFHPDWELANSLRVILAEKEDGERFMYDYIIEPVKYDAGLHFELWLKGYNGVTLKSLIDLAARLKLIDAPVMEAYRRTFTLGAETVHVEFECRRGATREEKDLAFFEALAQIGEVNYVTVGDLPACSTCEHDPAACKDAGVCAISRQEV